MTLKDAKIGQTVTVTKITGEGAVNHGHGHYKGCRSLRS